MAAPDIANSPNPTSHVLWRALAFACLGAIAGAGYGYGVSVVTAAGPITAWILALVGSGLLGLTGYSLSDSPDYSALQKVILIPLVPLVFVASSVGVVLAIALLGVLYPVFAFLGFRRDRRFRAEMKAAGRYLTWQELLPSLESGRGTLIEESYGTGPFRIWYTPDDVLAKGEPISTNEEILGVLSGKISHVFNSRCLREYLESANGTASLTNIRPARVRTERFQKTFPQVRIVRLIHRPGQTEESKTSPTE